MQLPSVQSLLKKYRIYPKKRLGQNYLIAQPTMKKIVDSLGAAKDDVVLEIGCGFGVMTAMLAEKCKRVIAIDADVSSLDIARQEFGTITNIEWIHADILSMDISSCADKERLLAIGNIPYNISSPILFHLLDYRECVARAILMMQKEVVDRVVAKPGGKDYGALSVMLQSFACCKKLFNVARTNFIPPPEVTSSVVELVFPSFVRRGRGGRLTNYPSQPPLTKGRGDGFGNRRIPAFENLRRVVQAAFQQRRKTLRNALLGSKNLKLKSEDLDRILTELKIDAGKRPETLSVEEFHHLAEALR